MPKLKFFDCNCAVGRVSYPNLLDIPDAKGLLAEMDTAGVDEALVYHTLARDADAPTGNRILHEEIDGISRLHPVWVVLPHHTDEMPSPHKLLRDMEKKGVKAVKMFPGRSNHSFSLREWNSGMLINALDEAKVPLMLDVEIVGWDDIVRLIKKYPRLPLICTNASYRHNRFLYPIFEKYENIYIEISRFYGAGVIEDIVRRFGPHPVLFGSNMPQYTGTSPVAMVSYADISIEDREAIAGGNLRIIFEEALS